MKRAIVVDIEGTVGSISFVRAVLFPYAKRMLPDWIARHGQQPETRRWLDQVSDELRASGKPSDDDHVLSTLLRFVDEDRKHTALKALQGLLWEDGYRHGESRAHIYPDAATKLRDWHADGHRLYVYSSGSVAAQRLFFEHTEQGNLLPLFSGFFDTEIGGKREPQSYERIRKRISDGQSTEAPLFCSDVLEELDAARAAQLETLLVDREMDYPSPRLDSHGHRRVTSFADCEVSLVHVGR